MTSQMMDLLMEVAALEGTVASLKERITELTGRIQKLETMPEVAAALQPPPPPVEEISEETLLMLSAAIAAYLGKKPVIRQIRLVTSPTWANVGRASIQASHALTRKQGDSL